VRLIATVARLLGRTYPDPVGISRSMPDGYIPPLRRPEGIEEYAGQWVAIAGGKVIVAAGSSRELAVKLRALGSEAQDAVMQYVRPPVAGYIIGVG
jgi:hypothetical protein